MKKIPLTDSQIADAQRLKAIYEAKKKTLGLSQDILAEKIGMGQSGVTQLLNAKNAINVFHAAKFAKVLEINIDDFSPSLAAEIAELATYIVDKNGKNEISKRLTQEQEELLGVYDGLPSEEAQKFLREMKTKRSHFNKIFDEMLAKRGSKAG
ncbi:helix-turn-helix domain-containing protein [Photorhabdus thracensis]|nr:helix-turn-helix domain-containing protein [Photorhabdus thracensis]